MSGHRGARAAIQTLYLVARAWLALTTPCGAQTEGAHLQGGVAVERQLVATRTGVSASQKFFQPMSIRPDTARLRDGVARCGTLM